MATSTPKRHLSGLCFWKGNVLRIAVNSENKVEIKQINCQIFQTTELNCRTNTQARLMMVISVNLAGKENERD